MTEVGADGGLVRLSTAFAGCWLQVSASACPCPPSRPLIHAACTRLRPLSLAGSFHPPPPRHPYIRGSVPLPSRFPGSAAFERFVSRTLACLPEPRGFQACLPSHKFLACVVPRSSPGSLVKTGVGCLDLFDVTADHTSTVPLPCRTTCFLAPHLHRIHPPRTLRTLKNRPPSISPDVRPLPGRESYPPQACLRQLIDTGPSTRSVCVKLFASHIPPRTVVPPTASWLPRQTRAPALP